MDGSHMQKEILIVVIIVVAIITLNYITTSYTRNGFEQVNSKLDAIKNIGNELLNEEKEENITLISEKIKDLEDEWKIINKKTSFYLEHDELEKVNSSMVKFKSFFELGEYSEAIPELENCKYILRHIKDKESLNPINLF